LRDLPRDDRVVLDLSAVEVLDTGGAWLITTLIARLKGEGVEVALRGATEAQRTQIDTVARSLPEAEAEAERRASLRGWL